MKFHEFQTTFSDTGAYDFKVWEPLDGPPMIIYGEAYFNDYVV